MCQTRVFNHKSFKKCWLLDTLKNKDKLHVFDSNKQIILALSHTHTRNKWVMEWKYLKKKKHGRNQALRKENKRATWIKTPRKKSIQSNKIIQTYMSVVSKNRRDFFSAKAAIIIQSVLKIKILYHYIAMTETKTKKQLASLYRLTTRHIIQNTTGETNVATSAVPKK